ncbi:gastric inhibitory polypeptide receptor isoform X5 [Ranitomeya variabilis]|uniref:gastric inhibitory polypeptide receptor isoform X5 n=1 Tax=Ranitomeya variabilis TaxID=490064 RepID=UPI0040575E2C
MASLTQMMQDLSVEHRALATSHNHLQRELSDMQRFNAVRQWRDVESDDRADSLVATGMQSDNCAGDGAGLEGISGSLREEDEDGSSTDRRLCCTRNLIHCNLFVSFILRAVSLLTRDALLEQPHGAIQGEEDLTALLRERTLVGCRVAQTITQYCVAANYYWLLVEGLYLHNLLLVLSFSEEAALPRYMVLGWGAPILFVIPWVVMRQLYENTHCWERNDNRSHWWIIRSPILLAVLVNFIIFLRIVRILVLKLRANQMRRSDRKYRLAKSTLTLIPLLGIHEAIFNLIPEESATGRVRYSKLGLELLLSSVHGLLVAVLYCICNKEVQAELRRKLQDTFRGEHSCAPRSLHPPSQKRPRCREPEV